MERERERDCSKEVNPADRQELARAYRAMMSLTESPWRQEIRGPSRMTSCNLARHSTSEGGLLVPVGGMSRLAQTYNPTIPNTLPNPVCVCVCVCVRELSWIHSLYLDLRRVCLCVSVCVCVCVIERRSRERRVGR